MATQFPTAVDTFSNPTATDYLDSPNHAEQHSDVNGAVEAVQTKVGIGASTPVANTVLKGTGVGTSTFGQIVNADIDAAAAIPYSKLNLASSITTGDIANGAILNADVNAAAAIDYTKLALALSIVNGDVSASAAIAYSKLNLALSIVNADINASAAIDWTKMAATAWTAYTPTFSNWVIGSATVATRYFQFGKTVIYRGKVTWAADTSSAGVMGVSLPVTAFSGALSFGSGMTLDSAPGTFYLGTVFHDATYLYMTNNNTGQAVAGNYATPFTFTTGDVFEWQLTYEAA